MKNIEYSFQVSKFQVKLKSKGLLTVSRQGFSTWSNNKSLNSYRSLGFSPGKLMAKGSFLQITKISLHLLQFNNTIINRAVCMMNGPWSSSVYCNYRQILCVKIEAHTYCCHLIGYPPGSNQQPYKKYRIGRTKYKKNWYNAKELLYEVNCIRWHSWYSIKYNFI